MTLLHHVLTSTKNFRVDLMNYLVSICNNQPYEDDRVYSDEDRAEVEARRMQAKRLMTEQGGEGGGKGGEKDLSGLEEELRAKLGF